MISLFPMSSIPTHEDHYCDQALILTYVELITIKHNTF